MSGVSEAAVLLAAEAIYVHDTHPSSRDPEWADVDRDVRLLYVESARAALEAALPAIRADIAAEVQAATWDEVGGSMWFDRHQWGVIIDGLVLQRAEALTRKAANEYSNSDERAEMCVDLIRQINAADPLALSTAKEATNDPACECEMGWQCDFCRQFARGYNGHPTNPTKETA
jgi:hypothetical protein